MILPRPIPKEVDTEYLLEYIRSRFIKDEVFEVCGVRGSFRYVGIGEKTNIVYAMLGKGAQRKKFGLYSFYANVKKDIGLAFDTGQLPPTIWLCSGVDGETNLVRLCKAFAENGEILPQDTVAGKRLLIILKESNEAVKLVSDPNEIMAAIDMIDAGLVKYNTYLDNLIERSRLKRKV